MNLLLYFALPVATVILSVVWQRIIKSPLLVALTAFAIYLIVVYAIDSSLLIFAIIYTILSFIAATIARFITNNLGGNGLFKNINAENINTDTLNTNTLNVDDNNVSSCGCNRYMQQDFRRNNRYR